ncbi:MAG: type I-E CRISPR-associated protein Cse1/CasA [Thermoleophilia bacterium]
MTTYDILKEPWIEAVTLDGNPVRLGLLGVLEKAPELSSLVDPSPLVRCGIYRLLVAFVMDAFWLKGMADIEDVFEAALFDRDVVARYVDDVGRSRFDLFDIERPFLQSRPAEEIPDPAPGPVARLLQHLPSGNFATHFCHGRADEHAFSPAVCAQALAAVAPFMTAGGAGFSPSVNGMPPWYVLVRGRNLFETVVLNCAPLDNWEEDEPTPPAWRRDEPVVPKRERACTSPLEALTWQPRRIRLIPGEGGVCTYSGESSPVLIWEAVFTYGFKSTGGWLDPHVSYRSSDKGPSPLRPREGRQLWRDTGPLLLLREEHFRGERGEVRYQRPYVVRQREAFGRTGQVDLRSPPSVDAYGARTEGDMKIFEWRMETLSVPAQVFYDPRAPVQLQEAMEAAQRVEYHLQRATKMLYPRGGGGNSSAFERLITRIQHAYWDALRGEFTNRLLPQMAAQDPDDLTAPETLRASWAATVRATAHASFDNHADSLDADGSALRRLVEARRYLAMKTTPRKPEATEETPNKEE